MKITKSLINRIICLGLCVLVLSLALTPYVYASKNKRIVKVGYYDDGNFLSGTSEEDVKSGYYYEYMQRLAEYTGWEYEYVHGELDDLYKMLLDGEIDLLPGIGYIKEREGLIGYPTQPMCNTPFSFVKRKGDTTVDEESIAKSEKKIGVVQGVMEHVARNYLEEHGFDAELVVYGNLSERDKALRKKDVDIIIVEGNGADISKNMESFAIFGREDFYLCTNIRDNLLLKELNEGQQKLFANNPQIILDLESKYLGQISVSSALSASERDWVANHKVFRIGYYNDYLPYSATDANGSATGIITDLVTQMLKSLSIDKGVSVQYQGFDDYDAMRLALQSKEIDAIFPLYTHFWSAEQNRIMPSLEVISISSTMAYRGKYRDLTKAKLAIVRGNGILEDYIRTNYADAQCVYYADIYECLDAVLMGDADGTLINGIRSDAILRQDKYSSLNVAQVSDVVRMGFGVRKDDYDTLEIINHGINLLERGFAINHANKYGIRTESETILDFLRNHLGLVISALFFVIALAVGLFIAVVILIRVSKSLERGRRKLASNNEAIARAGYGIWHIEVRPGAKPRMEINRELKKILGIQDQILSKEELYEFWYDRINKEDGIFSNDVSDLHVGNIKERVFIWNHPAKGEVYHRLGGSVDCVEDKGYILSGYCSDVTELLQEQKAQEKAIEEALRMAEAANKAKTTFLNSMSHDIRTPMNAIVGFTALAASHIDDKEQLKNYLDKITTSSNHLLSLINDVLDMSRIESGKVVIEEKETYLPEIINDINDIMQTEADRKNMEFKLETHNILNEHIICDKLRINQVLLNLLSNAIKYTQQGGRVELSVSQKNRTIDGYADYEFVVKDNGIGMSEEFLTHLFEPFERARTATVSGIQGTGLGMAITKNIVDMMGGTILVKSEQNVGTEIAVNFQFKTCDASAERKEAMNGRVNKMRKPIDVEEFKGKKLLLVEDNEINQEIATAILGEMGFVIDIANDGDVAVEKVSTMVQGQYDIVLMDIQMPKMDGYTATREIRTLGTENSNIPIIAMTANAFDEDRKKAFTAGMDGHVSKPIRVAELQEVLLNILSR